MPAEVQHQPQVKVLHTIQLTEHFQHLHAQVTPLKAGTHQQSAEHRLQAAQR